MLENQRLRITALIAKRINGRINAQENKELEDWAALSPGRRQLVDELSSHDILMRELLEYDALDSAATRAKLALHIPALRGITREQLYKPRSPLWGWVQEIWMNWGPRKWIVAGALALIIATAVCVPYFHHSTAPSIVTKAVPINKDLPPSISKPLSVKYLQPMDYQLQITLPNGVSLDAATLPIGLQQQYGNVLLRKEKEGTLIYSRVNIPEGSEGLHLNNRLATPKGGWYNIVLPDGSKVLLNAASSLSFTASFGREDRNINLTGEAYFEVAHHARPFIVQLTKWWQDDIVKVSARGTAFNVAAYKEDSCIKTTLLEGSVRVEEPAQETHRDLDPGQQYAQYANGKELLQQVDLEQTMAWRKDQFIFTKEPLPNVMRQLSRWYDAEVIYQGAPPGMLVTAVGSRKESIAAVLKRLENTGSVRFTIDRRQIIVAR
jgi:ferric-dicitrate binding protein FerR (iron transport regulator)